MAGEKDEDGQVLEGLIERIDERLAAMKMTQSAASRAAGNPSLIANIRRKTSRSPDIGALAALARVLDTTPEWLVFKRGGPRDRLAGGPVAGSLPITCIVAAGLWQEMETAIDYPVFEDIHVPPSPMWPAEAQFGAIVRGTSINRVARDGDVLACVDIARSGLRPQAEDMVIVERRRDGGAICERTAKRYRERAGVFELWPDSNDPRWRDPLVIDPNDESDEGLTIALVGIVTYVFASIGRFGLLRR